MSDSNKKIILVLGVIIFCFAFMVNKVINPKDYYADKKENPVINGIINEGESDSEVKEIIEVGEMIEIENSDFLMLELRHLNGWKPNFKSKYDYKIIRNYLITNYKTNESKWLYDNIENVIISYKIIKDNQDVVDAILITHAPYKNDEDGYMIPSDKVNYSLYSLKTNTIKTLLTDIDIDVYQDMNYPPLNQ